MTQVTTPRPQTQDVTEKPVPRDRVLIIEDDAVQAIALSYRLNKQGFEVVTAQSGSRGLELAREKKPVLIVLDLRLPDIDGLSVCTDLSDAPETCDVPVIIVSGLERPDIIRSARAAGCRYYVRKPYDPNVLLTLIQDALADGNGWDD